MALTNPHLAFLCTLAHEAYSRPNPCMFRSPQIRRTFEKSILEENSNGHLYHPKNARSPPVTAQFASSPPRLCYNAPFDQMGPPRSTQNGASQVPG